MRQAKAVIKRVVLGQRNTSLSITVLATGLKQQASACTKICFMLVTAYVEDCLDKRQPKHLHRGNHAFACVAGCTVDSRGSFCSIAVLCGMNRWHLQAARRWAS